MRIGNNHKPARLPDAVREADVLRVDFPAGPMRWFVISVGPERVSLRTAINNIPTSIDKEYLRHLMRNNQVRRETPIELRKMKES